MSVIKINTSCSGIETYRLTNANGLTADVITYGARLDRITVPTSDGGVQILAGFSTADGYMGDNPYFNAVIGRVVSRIAKGKFTLNGKEYTLYRNDGENSLHGGKNGFDRKNFSAKIVGDTLMLSYLSVDGEEGYPGNLTITVTYTLTDEGELILDYTGVSDEDTLFNPTNHAYFNLNGDFESVIGHTVYIDSDRITAADEGLVSTGEVVDITGSAFDFSTPKTIGTGIQIGHKYLDDAHGGYDCNYILRGKGLNKPVAYAIGDKSGIRMEVYTDRPCMQLYTGNFLDGSVVGRKAYTKQSAFCMETQGYTNAINIPSFPKEILKKGELFTSRTIYKFL